MIYSKTEESDVLERKVKLESAGARVIESGNNGEWTALMSSLTGNAEEISQRCPACYTSYARLASGV